MPTFARCRRATGRCLVQGVNLHLAAADALLRRFAFLPYSRLDDLLVSHAVPGGGVGPHVDSYDVFLLQGEGRRRWRIGRARERALRPNLPLKILARFRPEHDCVLKAGDMLYLPPAIAHDGIAIDTCSTYSIGFRAPSAQEVATGFLDWLRDRVVLEGRFADPGRRLARSPARIDHRAAGLCGRDPAPARLGRARGSPVPGRASHRAEALGRVRATPAGSRAARPSSASRRAARRALGQRARSCSTMNATFSSTAKRCPGPRAAGKRSGASPIGGGFRPPRSTTGAWPWFYRWYCDGFLHVD